MNREEYLEILTEQIHDKNAKKLVRDEIAAHIEDQKEAYLLDGAEEKEAEELAVKEMGSPVEAGVQLDKVHRPKTSFFMIGSILLLTLVGIIMQTIIFSQCDNQIISTEYHWNTIFYNLIGFVVIAALSFFDYRLLGKYIWLLYPGYLAGSMVLPKLVRYWGQMLLAGNVVNMVFVVLFAVFVYKFRGEKWKGILKCFGILAVNSILLLLFGYYISGRMLLSVMVCLITILVAAGKGIFGGNGKKQAGILAATVIGLPTLLVGDILLFDGRHLALAEYQIRRIQVMFNPSAFENAEGYLATVVRRQISAAELFGGGSLGEVGHITGSWSEYVLACMTSYFGILAAVAVVFLITAFLMRAFFLSAKQKNRLGFLIGVSCSSLLIMKTVLYVAMNFGIGFTIGMDMPFLTYGCSNTLMNSLFIGFILSVYRHTNLFSELKGEKIRFRLEKVTEKGL